MSSLLVQDIRDASLAQLASRASQHGMSLQREVQAILEAAAAAPADHEELRGWGMELPVPLGAELDLDSVDQLEAFLGGPETTLEDRVYHFMPWTAPEIW